MYEYGVPFGEAKTKMVDGKALPSTAFLFAPDLEKPSTWKLPILDKDGEMTAKQLGAAAAALGPGFRGQRAELPAEARKAAAKKLIGLYGKLDKEPPPYLKRMVGGE